MEYFKICFQLSLYLCGIMFFAYLSSEILYLIIENNKKRKLNKIYDNFLKEITANKKDEKK